VLAPDDGTAVVVLPSSSASCIAVGEAVRRRAVPVVLAGLEEDPVVGPDDLDTAPC
jgi:hypothetical protein